LTSFPNLTDDALSNVLPSSSRKNSENEILVVKMATHLGEHGTIYSLANNQPLFFRIKQNEICPTGKSLFTRKFR